MPSLDISSVALLLLGSALTGAGFLLKRLLTGASQKERTERIAHVVDIAAKMAEHGISQQEIMAVEQFILTKKRERLLAAPGKAIIDADAAEVLEEARPDGYWAQQSMNARAAAAFETAAAQLQQLLLELEHYLGVEVWEVQASWEGFRDRQADLVASEFAGGSIAPLIRASEAEALTVQRIGWAKAHLEQKRQR